MGPHPPGLKWTSGVSKLWACAAMVSLGCSARACCAALLATPLAAALSLREALRRRLESSSELDIAASISRLSRGRQGLLGFASVSYSPLATDVDGCIHLRRRRRPYGRRLGGHQVSRRVRVELQNLSKGSHRRPAYSTAELLHKAETSNGSFWLPKVLEVRV